MDQFASKVVEKCLKIGGADFLERYLERVCEGRADRPRIPLIDSKSSRRSHHSTADPVASRKRSVRELSHSIHPYACKPEPS